MRPASPTRSSSDIGHPQQILTFTAAKGGSGTSVVAAATALTGAEAEPTLLVDLAGDQTDVLGLPRPSTGLNDWFASEHPPPDALSRLEVPVTERLSLLPLETPGLATPDRGGHGTRLDLLGSLLETDGRRVVVDLGTSGHALRCGNARSVLVVRPCYLNLKRSLSLRQAPEWLVIVTEPGRALRESDVSDALGRPVVATLRWDPAVGRAVDAGLLVRRLPRSLRALGELW